MAKKETKKSIKNYINDCKEKPDTKIAKEQLALFGKQFTFIDLFAGAGGFSEGFLQAEVNNKFFDFLIANDINENCELTHLVRYNHQLGLNAGFLCQDITESNFIENLLNKIGNRKIDVVCGGPPCQSFSLAGKRKKFDKKDDLFAHYLEVIKILQPKYFVMENVKGILTKEKGKIKERILKEINSIIDINEVPKLITFLKKLKQSLKQNDFLIECLIKRIDIEKYNKNKKEKVKEEYIKFVETKFRLLIPKFVDYKTSKTDDKISTIRHGFNLLIRNRQWEKLKKNIIKEKDYCNIDNDYFVEPFNDFLTQLDSDEIIKKIETAFRQLNVPDEFKKDCSDIVLALIFYKSTFDDCLPYIRNFCNEKQRNKLKETVENIRLYKIKKPFIANSSNYGVPQNRERVLFIGCRKDQKLISDIPPTVEKNQKVTIFEALYDLDFVGNDDEAHNYALINILKKYNGKANKMQKLLRKRAINGKTDEKNGRTFSEWSKKGRLSNRYPFANQPFYVRNIEALRKGIKLYKLLNNHKTSNQNNDVIKRLGIILNEGNYKKAQKKLNDCGLASNKRNYNVLKPDEQSPTIMTIPDDYIHYNSPRALTVREMARLQSFDDSFVFQGKRSTGGNNRKTEVPQYTLVGNAIPPLMARAVAIEILKEIK